MSGKSTRRRRKRQRTSRKQRRTPARTAHADRPSRHTFELVEYEISYEPMEAPLRQKLSLKDRERINHIGEQIQEGGGVHVEELEQLVAQFPHIPHLYNYLSAAYANVGEQDKCDQLTCEIYRRFPNYLFGIANYALLCMRSGRVNEVPAVLKHEFSLHTLYPDRRRFHVTEFATFNAIVGEYFWRIGEQEIAKWYYEMISEVAPDHPLTNRLKSFVMHGLLARAITNLSNSLHSRRAKLLHSRRAKLLPR